MGSEYALQLLLQMKDEASEKLEGIKSKVGGMNTALLGLGAAAVAGVGAVTAALIDAGKAAAEEEQGIARMTQALKANAQNWEEASTVIEEYLDTMRKKVALDDGEGRESMTRLISITKDYEKAIELNTIAIDLAHAKNIDLKTATEMVGQTFMGNGRALKQFGIDIKETEEPIKALADAVKGQGEAFANTYVGKMKQAEIAMGNLKETVGGVVLPIMTRFATALADLAEKAMPKVQEVADAIAPVLQGVFGWIEQNVVPTLQKVVRYVQAEFPQISRTVCEVMTLVQELIATILPIIAALWQEYGDEIISIVALVFDTISKTIQAAMEMIRAIINIVLGIIQGDWDRVLNAVWSLVQTIFDLIKGRIEFVMDLINIITGGKLSELLATWRAKLEEIMAKVMEIYGQIRAFIETTIAAIVAFLSGMIETIKQRIIQPYIDAYEALFGEAGIWPRLRATLSEFLASVLNGIVERIEPTLDAITTPYRRGYDAVFGPDGFLTRLRNSIGGWASSIVSGLTNGLAGVWDAIVGPFRGAINEVINLINRLIDAWNFVIGALGGTPIGRIPLLGTGGGSYQYASSGGVVAIPLQSYSTAATSYAYFAGTGGPMPVDLPGTTRPLEPTEKRLSGSVGKGWGPPSATPVELEPPPSSPSIPSRVFFQAHVLLQSGDALQGAEVEVTLPNGRSYSVMTDQGGWGGLDVTGMPGIYYLEVYAPYGYEMIGTSRLALEAFQGGTYEFRAREIEMPVESPAEPGGSYGAGGGYGGGYGGYGGGYGGYGGGGAGATQISLQSAVVMANNVAVISNLREATDAERSDLVRLLHLITQEVAAA